MRYCYWIYIVFLTGMLNAAEVSSDSAQIRNPAGAMIRSAVVPGWGQFYNGKWFKGIVIAGVEAGLLTNAVVLHQYMQAAETQEERDFYWDNRNLSLWWLGASILYSMADAYVDAHLSDFDASPDLSLNSVTRFTPCSIHPDRFYRITISFHIK